MAAAESPEIEAELERIRDSGETSALVDITDPLTLTKIPPKAFWSDREQAVIDCLKTGPHSVLALSGKLGVSHAALLPLGSLEAAGVITRIWLTPTDMLYVSGEYAAWNRWVSLLGAEVFAGDLGATVSELVQMVREQIVFAITREVISKLVSDESGIAELSPDRLCSLFVAKALSG